MEIILSLAKQFWPMTVFIILVIIGLIINLFDKKIDNRVNFKYKEFPHLKPIPIATKGKGFWGAVWMWLTGVRTWEVADDWAFKINGQWQIIPQGFVFDGASIPKFLHTWLSPTGVLLMGGLVHDYAYKYATLLKSGKKKTMGTITQKKADEIFRDINIEQNGFHLLNKLAYWALRIGGFVAWNKHRKVNAKI